MISAALSKTTFESQLLMASNIENLQEAQIFCNIIQ